MPPYPPKPRCTAVLSSISLLMTAAMPPMMMEGGGGHFLLQYS